MEKSLIIFAVIMFNLLCNTVIGQNKNCYLSDNDLIRLVGANDKTVNNTLLSHCFVFDKTANNGAKTNFRRNYEEDGKLNRVC